jgi:hypothetical protein
MICLRYGYCCKNYLVSIVNDPDKGVEEGNIIVHLGDGKPCKHLAGDKPGEYSCAIHDRLYYGKTPCSEFTQVEQSNSNCRMGEYILNKLKNVS